MNTKFNIGDKVWYAGIHCIEKYVVCPVCFGKLFITLILGDDSQAKLKCDYCAAGFEEPSGRKKYWAWEPEVRPVTIDRIEINNSTVEYGHSKSYRVSEDEIYTTLEKAEQKAQEKMEQHNKQELNKIYNKELQNKRWSWHVGYYQRNIKEALRKIEWYEQKLCIAKEKSEKRSKK